MRPFYYILCRHHMSHDLGMHPRGAIANFQFAFDDAATLRWCAKACHPNVAGWCSRREERSFVTESTALHRAGPTDVPLQN